MAEDTEKKPSKPRLTKEQNAAKTQAIIDKHRINPLGIGNSTPEINTYTRIFRASQDARMELMNQLRMAMYVQSDTAKQRAAGEKVGRDYLAREFKDEVVLKWINEGKLHTKTYGTLEQHPFHQVIEALYRSEALMEQWLKERAEEHPLWVQIKDVKCLGPILFCRLISSMDSFADFKRVSSLWARAGMAGGNWREPNNFSRKTRVAVHLIGTAFLKGQFNPAVVASNEGTFYVRLCQARLAYEKDNNDRGLYAEYAGKELQRLLSKPKVNKKSISYLAYMEGRLPEGQIQHRAARYTAKQLLKDLWNLVHQNIDCLPMDGSLATYPRTDPAAFVGQPMRASA